MEYLVTPDIVEYVKNKMNKPVYDLILGCRTMKEIGIVLDFQTREITIDEIILPMRDANSPTKSKMEKSLDCEQQHGTQTKQYVQSNLASSSYPRC